MTKDASQKPVGKYDEKKETNSGDALTDAIRHERDQHVEQSFHIKNQPRSHFFYALLSLGAFICTVGLIAFYVYKGNDPNISSNLFYVLSVCLGCSAGAFLFGAMRSYAVFKGKVLGGLLEIGGPVVAAAMVVVGGFYLEPGSTSFDVTVYVHGSDGMTDRILKNQGKVTMHLGKQPRSEPIRENGDAHFDGIPSEFFGQEIPVMLDVEGFEVSDPNKKLILTQESVYLEVKRDDSLALIYGMVQSSDGTPLKGAVISRRGQRVTTTENGYFEMRIPAKHQQREYTITISFKNYEIKRKVVRPGSEIPIRLKESKK